MQIGVLVALLTNQKEIFPGDQILANQNTAQITCTLVWYVDRESCSRALYSVDIWDGPAIRLFFTKYDTYILNLGKKGKRVILKTQLSCPKV